MAYTFRAYIPNRKGSNHQQSAKIFNNRLIGVSMVVNDFLAWRLFQIGTSINGPYKVVDKYAFDSRPPSLPVINYSLRFPYQLHAQNLRLRQNVVTPIHLKPFLEEHAQTEFQRINEKNNRDRNSSDNRENR